ncbi:hydroxymethylglutaryl-CoA lyase, mitochondrial [Dorcoceras hygrometricum]|uniref:Hydroxymethylglutaryl-CoA lyase, mitochondrial n=1 Tax=Dorcoceras hygrometricum TaxID=472368 RepID=A0A2Z7CEQ3_9LAMI|nr:hydroxymethylglutaryl-CoA lyase, mitochondrial [Dorcoceras hygrometricum]
MSSSIFHCLSCEMVKRKATEAVDMELQERTFETNHVVGRGLWDRILDGHPQEAVAVFFAGVWADNRLNCSSTYPAIPEEDGFRRRHFPGMSTVTLVDLRARIDKFEGETEVEVDVKKIKLTSLYFVSADWVGPRYKRKKLAYEEVLFGLRKNLGARFEEFTNLAKKRKRDPNFSGFESLHLSGFVQPFGECGVYAIAAAAFTLAERNVYTLNDALVAAFRKFCACSLWNQSWMLV